MATEWRDEQSDVDPRAYWPVCSSCGERVAEDVLAAHRDSAACLYRAARARYGDGGDPELLHRIVAVARVYSTSIPELLAQPRATIDALYQQVERMGLAG